MKSTATRSSVAGSQELGSDKRAMKEMEEAAGKTARDSAVGLADVAAAVRTLGDPGQALAGARLQRPDRAVFVRGVETCRVSRMSAATSGFTTTVCDDPGCRCAHPGYALVLGA